jgi:hypothetical protein
MLILSRKNTSVIYSLYFFLHLVFFSLLSFSFHPSFILFFLCHPFLFIYRSVLFGPGVALGLMHCATSRKVPGSIPGVAGVFFSVASDISMCPGVDSASKNEYQVKPGGKGGRCVRLTNYHLHLPMSRNLVALTSWKPVGLFRPVMGQFFDVITSLVSLDYWGYGWEKMTTQRNRKSHSKCLV